MSLNRGKDTELRLGLSFSILANKTYINSVTVQGFIGADAHPKELDGGKIVLNFSLATSRFRGEGSAREQFTEWHRITVWDKLAGSTGHLAKGAHVNVIG
jgi:single-stranded DNA-binding protein